jgi:3',5'-cyclic-nucleotide phosphodiesterase
MFSDTRMIGLFRSFSDPSLNFDVFEPTPEELVELVVMLFKQSGELALVGLELSRLAAFVEVIRKKYNDHPFHNWLHAVSVLHVAWHLIRVIKTETPVGEPEVLNPLERLALLLAAMVHDVDHPAQTNAFQIDAFSHLALTHNDQAVLENHHLVTAFTAATSNDVRLFEDMEPGTKHFLRSRIISCVFATDMKNHFQMCKRIDGVTDLAQLHDTEEAREFMCNVVVHCADLSAQVLETPLAMLWEERITKEFEREATQRRSLNLPVPDFMSGLEQPAVRAKKQLGFLDFVVAPLWKGVARLLPPLQMCRNNLDKNRKHYSAIANPDQPHINAPLRSNTFNQTLPEGDEV